MAEKKTGLNIFILEPIFLPIVVVETNEIVVETKEIVVGTKEVAAETKEVVVGTNKAAALLEVTAILQFPFSLRKNPILQTHFPSFESFSPNLQYSFSPQEFKSSRQSFEAKIFEFSDVTLGVFEKTKTIY